MKIRGIANFIAVLVHGARGADLSCGLARIGSMVGTVCEILGIMVCACGPAYYNRTSVVAGLAALPRTVP